MTQNQIKVCILVWFYRPVKERKKGFLPNLCYTPTITESYLSMYELEEKLKCFLEKAFFSLIEKGDIPNM